MPVLNKKPKVVPSDFLLPEFSYNFTNKTRQGSRPDVFETILFIIYSNLLRVIKIIS